MSSREDLLALQESDFNKTSKAYADAAGEDSSVIDMKYKKEKSLLGAIKGFFGKLFPKKEESSSGSSKVDNPAISSVSTENQGKFSGLDKYHVKVGLVIAGFIFFGSMIWGLLVDGNEVKKAPPPKASSTDKGVQGTHLENVPKDYAALAAAEARKKREREMEELRKRTAKQNSTNTETPKVEVKREVVKPETEKTKIDKIEVPPPITATPPSLSSIPVQQVQRPVMSEDMKESLKEIKQAMSSPIGFATVNHKLKE